MRLEGCRNRPYSSSSFRPGPRRSGIQERHPLFLCGRSIFDSGEYDGKTKCCPVFPIWTDRSIFCKKSSGGPGRGLRRFAQSPAPPGFRGQRRPGAPCPLCRKRCSSRIFFLMLLHDHPLSVSGKQAGKTKSRPVFLTSAERARVLQEMPRNGRLAAIRAAANRAAAIRALRRVAAGRLQRPRQRPAAGCGQGGDDGRDRTERTPARRSGRISGVDRDRYRDKYRNVKEKSEKIGEISRTCPGAAAPAKRNTAAVPVVSRLDLRLQLAACSRSRNFWILPVEVLGSSPNTTAVGHL